MTHWRALLPLGTGTWTSLGFAQSSRTTVSRSSARVDLSKKPACVFEFIRLSPQTSPSGSCETNETRFPPRQRIFLLVFKGCRSAPSPLHHAVPLRSGVRCAQGMARPPSPALHLDSGHSRQGPRL